MIRKSIFAILSLAAGILLAGCGSVPHPSVQEYIPEQGNIKGNVDTAYFLEKSDDFAIGASADGYAVFKDPGRAFDTFSLEYAEAIKRIGQENSLDPLTRTDYAGYKTYGWQTGGTDEQQEQMRFVSSFLDIYENSF